MPTAGNASCPSARCCANLITWLVGYCCCRSRQGSHTPGERSLASRPRRRRKSYLQFLFTFLAQLCPSLLCATLSLFPPLPTISACMHFIFTFAVESDSPSWIDLLRPQFWSALIPSTYTQHDTTTRFIFFLHTRFNTPSMLFSFSLSGTYFFHSRSGYGNLG